MANRPPTQTSTTNDFPGPFDDILKGARLKVLSKYKSGSVAQLLLDLANMLLDRKSFARSSNVLLDPTYWPLAAATCLDQAKT